MPTLWGRSFSIFMAMLGEVMMCVGGCFLLTFLFYVLTLNYLIIPAVAARLRVSVDRVWDLAAFVPGWSMKLIPSSVMIWRCATERDLEELERVYEVINRRAYRLGPFLIT